MKAAVSYRQFVVRQSEVAFQPFKEGGFKDSAAAIERVAGQPNQFGPAEAQVTRMIELRDQLFMREGVYGACGRAVENGERHARLRVMLPDKLQHQQFVEVGIEQRTRNRVECPVVIVRPLREVHDHELVSSSGGGTKTNQANWIRKNRARN